MDLYQIWFRESSRGRNQLCGILLQSAHRFQFCEGSKFAISHWLGRSPLTQCWRYRAACDRQRQSILITRNHRMDQCYATAMVARGRAGVAFVICCLLKLNSIRFIGDFLVTCWFQNGLAWRLEDQSRSSTMAQFNSPYNISSLVVYSNHVSSSYRF